ncbi:MAG TPA: FAD:protein FMN transferase [Streptosporangiaceae bacterium]|jgi:thiamine biosynthesis lipoprotein
MPDFVRHKETVMGTVVSFAVRPAELPKPAVRAAIAAACAGLHQADAVFSTWDSGSPVSRLRRGAATPAQMPAEVGEVLGLCEQARALSRGWFDPWAMPGGVDPTGLVKGWAVERAAAALRAAGVTAALVNGGGDLTAFGEPEPGLPWRAGVRHPWRPAALACVLTVRGAVATSARYERGVHLIDPFRGRPADAVASATVTGPSLALADALATALAVGSDDALAAVAEAAGYQGYLIRADGSETDTGGMAFVS